MRQIQILILKRCRMDLGRKWNVEVIYLLFIVAGYTVFSSFATPLNIENSKIFSVPYRLLVFFFSITIIYRNFTFKKFKNIAVLSVIFFWILYFFKAYTSFNRDLYEEDFTLTFLEIYIRIIVIAWIPSTALLFINYKDLDLSEVGKGFFYILLVMLSLNLIYAFIVPHGLSLHFIFSVYYISFGHIGASLALISLFFLLFKSQEINKYLLWYALLLGIYTIVMAGARSPFLAIMVVTPYLLLLRKSLKLMVFFVLLLFLSVVGIYYFGKSEDYQLIFIDRTYQWIFNGDNSLRTPLFQRSLEIFKENPFFGGRTHYEDGMYPHNIFLELMMATGFVGLIAYLLKFIPVIKNIQLFSYKIQNVYHILFFTLFLQYFVLSSTSFALYSVPEFLYFSSIIIGISINYFNEKNESDDGRRNPSGNHKIS
jgi:O-antigen ligase